MAKKRVYEIAKERGVSSKELLSALQAAGVDVKAAASTVDEAEAAKALSADGGVGDRPAPAQADAKPPRRQPMSGRRSRRSRSATGFARRRGRAAGRGLEAPDRASRASRPRLARTGSRSPAEAVRARRREVGVRATPRRPGARWPRASARPARAGAGAVS